jgi:N-acetylglucosamine kinase-like BadF-type ATPase
VSERDIVIGLDGGQSATLALAARLDGTVIGSALAGPSNHYDEPGGPQRLESAVRDGLLGALADADLPAERVACVRLGMTGAPDQAHDIAARCIPGARVESTHDIETAWAGATAGSPGVVVIGGTGSVAYGRVSSGRTARAGGWGYLMGDEGSAYDLGIQALRAACQAHDGRAHRTSLTMRIPAALGLADIWAVRRAIYSPALTRADIAGLARVVSDAAHAEDSTARRLLRDAGVHLADAALAVLAALGYDEVGMTIYTTGGVFAAGEYILSSFRERLRRESPLSRVSAARFTPAVGALLLALEMAGVPLDAPLLSRIESSLPPNARTKGAV